MNPAGITALVQAVQTNCDIADERHAGDLSLCTYLLQMREFYRWEQGLDFGAPLARDAVGAWIARREALWAELAARDFVGLPCGPDGELLDPFNVEAVNACLRPQSLLYGAGLVGAERPVFFLAELRGHETREGLDVCTGGHELARGLMAPPAMLGGGERGPIVLRRAALARWVWEKFEAWTLRPAADLPFRAVVQAYRLDEDFTAALPRCLDEQSETLVLHELGEHHAGRLLGPRWAEMRLALPTRRTDLYARAVRDHLADLAVTLPTLMDRGAAAHLHFWFAGYDGVRALLFPGLSEAYTAWVHGDGGAALRHAVEAGAVHFERLAREALALHARGDASALREMEGLFTAPSAICTV